MNVYYACVCMCECMCVYVACVSHIHNCHICMPHCVHMCGIWIYEMYTLLYSAHPNPVSKRSKLLEGYLILYGQSTKIYKCKSDSNSAVLHNRSPLLVQRGKLFGDLEGVSRL